jgi:hypothetical protein
MEIETKNWRKFFFQFDTMCNTSDAARRTGSPTFGTHRRILRCTDEAIRKKPCWYERQFALLAVDMVEC